MPRFLSVGDVIACNTSLSTGRAEKLENQALSEDPSPKF
jgi:hypothetical protein